MVDTRDLKSLAGFCVPVRVRSPAPKNRNAQRVLRFFCGGRTRTGGSTPVRRRVCRSATAAGGSWRGDSGHRHLVGASSISFALICLQKSERAHATAPPLQIKPTSLGFDLVFRGIGCVLLSMIPITISAWRQPYVKTVMPVRVLRFFRGGRTRSYGHSPVPLPPYIFCTIVYHTF